MQYLVLNANEIEKSQAECLIVPVPQVKKLNSELSKIDAMVSNQLTRAIKEGDFSAELGQVFFLYGNTGSKIQRFLFVGVGPSSALSAKAFRDVVKSAASLVMKTKLKEAASLLHTVKVKNHDESWALREVVLGFSDLMYQFQDFKSQKQPEPVLSKLIAWVDESKKLKTAKAVLEEATQAASAIKLIKDLANTPPNICHPVYLAAEAKKLAAQYPSVSCQVLDEKAMKKLGMNVFLSVSQGSEIPGQLITLEYRGGKAKQAPIALIGKGITFDTGGNCIKPANGMLEMKYDMCGAATVMGIMQFCAAMKLPINVVGVIAAAENMLNGLASRPSDIVKSLSGLTVEISNTDAEGRLVLCDAMTYAIQKFKPQTMVTMATLTGAAIIALGTETTALMSNDDGTARTLLAAGSRAEDQAWQLPLFDEYHEHLKSEFADMINANLNRSAGTITAACYLSRFADGVKWAHLDIAGTATLPGRQAKASGRPFGLMMEYLLSLC